MEYKILQKRDFEQLDNKSLNYSLQILHKLYRESKKLFPWPSNLKMRRVLKKDLKVGVAIMKERSKNGTWSFES